LATGNATNIAQLGVGSANAQAAGQVGVANALSGGIQNAGNSMYLSTLLNPSTYTNSQQPGYGTQVPQGTMSNMG
jgi:hypothetical protein